jgi:hypothetical protein
LLAPLALGPSPGFNSIPARAVERPAQFRRCLSWLLLKLVCFGFCSSLSISLCALVLCSCCDLIDRFVFQYDS